MAVWGPNGKEGVAKVAELHAAVRKGGRGGSGRLQADHGGGGEALQGNEGGAGEIGEGDQCKDWGEGKELTSSLFEMPSEYCPYGGKRTEAQAPALRGALHSKASDMVNY